MSVLTLAVILVAGVPAYAMRDTGTAENSTRSSVEQVQDNAAVETAESPSAGNTQLDPGSSPSSISTVLIGSSATDSPVSLEFSYGYRNTAKSGHKLPFSAKIRNNTDRDISGRLVIAADGSVETGIDSFEPAVNSYAFEVEIPAQGETTFDNVISVAEESSAVTVMFYEGEECIYKRQEQIDISSDGAELLIGILSDTPGRLDYFDGVSVAQTTLRAKTTELDPDTLPQSALELEQLDLIVISNFDTDRINEAQLDAIETWAESGGVLLIGSGRHPEAAKSFGAYRENFEISEPYKEDIDMGMRYSKSGPDGAVLNLSVCNIMVQGGIQARQSADIATLTLVNGTQGTVGFAAYDLCDISEFCSQEMSFTDDLLTTMLGYARIDRLINSAGSSREVYDKTQEFMGITDSADLPNISLYIVFALAYTAAVGGFIYFGLRNRGLEIYYHAAVVMAAFAGAFAVWMISSGSRHEGLSLDYTAVREINGDSTSESGYIRIFSAAADSYSINIPKDYELYPIVHAAGEDEAAGGTTLTNVGSALEGRTDSLDRSELSYAGKLIAFAMDSDGKTINAEGLGPFAGTMAEFATDRRASTDSDAISARLKFFNEAFNGSIENKSPYDLEDAALLLYGRVAKLGRLSAGDTIDIEDLATVNVPTGDSFATAAYITDLYSLDTGDSAYADTLKKTRYLSSCIDELPESYYSGVRLIGFSEGENIFEDISTDRHADVSGTLLKSVAAEADFTYGRRVWRTALSTDPSVVSGDYDTASNTSRGSVVLEYSLGNDINVSSLYFTELAEVFRSESVAPFAGRMSMYNYVTGSYDDVDTGTSYTESSIAAYLSPANTLTVRYIPDTSLAAGAALFLPVPNINGEEK